MSIMSTCRPGLVGKTSVESEGLRCKYRKGDLIFAKDENERPWPAQVTEIWYEGTELDLDVYQVTFFGFGKEGKLKRCKVNSKNIWRYCPETLLKYGKNNKSCPAVFKRAIKEIEQQFSAKETKTMQGQEGELEIEENATMEDEGELKKGMSLYQVYGSEISVERDSDGSAPESFNESSSSKIYKIPVSPTLTPSESSGDYTFTSMDTDDDINDQDFGDVIGHEARSNLNSRALATNRLLSPSSSIATIVISDEEQVQRVDEQQETISGPMLQRPKSIRIRKRKRAAAAAAAAKAADSATTTNRHFRSRRASAKPVPATGSASMKKKRQGIHRLYVKFTLKRAKNAGGIPEKQYKCIVLGCKKFVTSQQETILNHMREKHLKGETGKIYVGGSADMDPFVCNFQGCEKTQYGHYGQSNMSRHTNKHLKKTV